MTMDGEFESLKSSSFSSESEEEEDDKYYLLSRSSSSSNSDRTWDMNMMMDDSSKKHLGQLYFQYFERDIPFGRVPLKDKVVIHLIFLVITIELSIHLIVHSFCV